MPTAIKEQDDLSSQVVDLRNADTSWAEISEQLGIGQGKAAFLYMCATVAPKDRIVAKDEDTLSAKIVEARDEHQLSWGQIAARASIPEGKVKHLYETASGTSTLGLRIGKGGRHPQDEGAAPAKAVAKAPRSTKATAKAAARGEAPRAVSAEEARKPLAEMSLAELKNRLNGKTMTVVRMSEGGKRVKVPVKMVKKLHEGEVTFSDADGATHTVLITEIKSATR